MLHGFSATETIESISARVSRPRVSQKSARVVRWCALGTGPECALGTGPESSRFCFHRDMRRRRNFIEVCVNLEKIIVPSSFEKAQCDALEAELEEVGAGSETPAGKTEVVVAGGFCIIIG